MVVVTQIYKYFKTHTTACKKCQFHCVKIWKIIINLTKRRIKENMIGELSCIGGRVRLILDTYLEYL